MNVFAPSFITSNSATDIVGFNVVAPDGASQSRITSFGQVFKAGQVSSLQNLQTSIGGRTELVQVDPKTFYPDGSIQFAVLSFRQPDLSSGQTIKGMLEIATRQASNQPVDVISVLGGHSASVTLSFSSGMTVSEDLLSIVRAAVLSGRADTWQSGPLITQIRVSTPIQDSLRLLTTVTAFSDGTFSISLGFNNDGAMAAQGGAKNYSASVSVDGTTTLQTGQITQAQYQNWNTTVWGGGGQAPSTIIQHDPAYLERAGAIPTFDLGNGVADYKIDSYANEMSQPSWEQPLSNNGVEKLMPTTGARPDIGITTEPTAVWLITQDPVAAKYALGQANASGAVPWNFWNTQAGTWLNTDQYSDIWVDGRGGTSDGGSVGLTQQVSDQTGWAPDTSHQPDLSYYAYIMTGDQKYLDSLNAQASNAITSTWEAYRGTQQLVVGYDQVRASAWNLREVDEAAWANPVDSVEGKYFAKISNANWKWLVDQIPNWTANQGEAYGQVEGYAWGSRSYSRPWMQDYFASVAAEAARHGNANAMTFLKWESNFLVGRFLNGANGFNPRDGVAYTLAMGPNDSDGAVRYKTWAEIGRATVAAGESNGNGWSNSIGDYGALGLVSLADIISLTGSTDAIKAYNFLVTSGAPFTSQADLAQSNQLNIKPDLPDGWAFAADRTIVQVAVPLAGPSGPTSGSLGQSADPTSTTQATTPASGGAPTTENPTTLPTQTVRPENSNPQPITPSQPPFPPLTTGMPPQDLAPSPITSGTNGAPPSLDVGQIGMNTPDTNSTVPINLGTVGGTQAAPVQPVALSLNAPQVTYRFFDTINGTQFLTSSEVERETLMQNPLKFTYEGHGMNSVTMDPSNPNVAPVFRFFNSGNGTHFFTTSENERDSILSTRPDLIQEQVNFAEHLQAEAGDIPVYRFFDTHSGDHFFTQSSLEYKNVILTRSDMVNEGIAFYAPS